MKRDLSTVLVPFPAGLMSTARAAAALGTDYAREIINMLATASGAGSKRGGCVPVGPALAGVGIVGLFAFQPTSGALQLVAVVDNAEIRVWNGSAWSTVYTGLNPAGVVRGVVFGGVLVLCNGLNDVLRWDGVTCVPVQQWVVEVGGSLTFVSATQFSVLSDAALYPVGREVRARLGSTLVTSTVQAVSQSGATTTVTLASGVLNNTLNRVEFGARPPRFNFLYAAHDRLWGCGRGALNGQALSPDVNRLRVFYTHGVNDASAWHDPTGVVPSLGLADKAAGQDEVLAMSVKDGLTVFFMRSSCQLWGGTNPSANGDFAWQKTIPVGLVHGSLVVELPNDIAFMSPAGVRTLARVVQTEQLDVSDVGSELDPTFVSLLGEIVPDVQAYRAVRTCAYAPQGWFGLKIRSRLFVFQLTRSGRGWVIFTGLPGTANAFATAPGGGLFLAVGGQVYQYSPAAFDDAGAPIETRWQTGWISPAGRDRWANSYTEVVIEQSAAMVLDVTRTRNLDDGNNVVATVEARLEPEYWDSGLWDTTYFDVATPTRSVVRDHFVAERVGLGITSTSTQGPLTVLGIQLYGRAEK
jgi:hypothetical protein